ncbi:universal stress protein [Tersicoccus sp. MR15.9]|uniref:universal stress protein n=1 Tax=Tersicoccus mangrovi TaxID=3121635 RepID=UPI002FE514D7
MTDQPRTGTPGPTTGSGPSEPLPVVVGVDGSDHSLTALRWAVEEARTRQAPLVALTAYSVPIFAASGMDGGYATIDDRIIRDGAQAVVKAALQGVDTSGLAVEASVESGDAAGVLLGWSEQAQLVVVGSRGRGGFVGRLLGSVSGALPAHAHCPIVTVPPPAKRADRVEDVVVAAVDGSEHARMAVVVAAEEARRSGLPLRLLCALPPITASMAWVPAPLDRDGMRHDIDEQMVAGSRWLAHHFPDVDISYDILDGVPVDVVVEASASARLVVLGTRGRGGFAGMLLGSTSRGVQAHARGPVMVVPDREDPRLADRPSFGPMAE